MDVAAAIEHRYGVRFTERQLVELTSVADFMDATTVADDVARIFRRGPCRV